MYPKIQEGAVFIADAHENEYRKEFWEFLKKLEREEIKASQLFLMGDMFDLLVGKVTYTKKKYEEYLKLIDSIAEKIPVFYFEGNHDFDLGGVFKYVHVIPIEEQPMKFSLPSGEVALVLHGDKYGSFFHSLYTKVIRNSFTLTLLKAFDGLFGNFIAKGIEQNQHKKNICKPIEDFQNVIARKIPKYKALKQDFILEGHYHQNRQFDFEDLKYVNFSSFACNQSFFIVKCSHNAKFAQMKLRGYNV